MDPRMAADLVKACHFHFEVVDHCDDFQKVLIDRVNHQTRHLIVGVEKKLTEKGIESDLHFYFTKFCLTPIVHSFFEILPEKAKCLQIPRGSSVAKIPQATSQDVHYFLTKIAKIALDNGFIPIPRPYAPVATTEQVQLAA